MKLHSSTATPEAAVEPRLMFTLLVMTFVTGLVDAVSYVGLGHVFTANMTGNVVLLGFAVGGAPQLSVSRTLTSLAAFLGGAVVGGRIAAHITARSKRGWLLTAGVAESAMLFLAAFGAFVLSPQDATRIYAIVVCTAIAMGLRMATVRRLAVPDITTTVLTTLLAGLAGDSILAGGDNPRLGRRIGSLVVMFAGAALGAGLLRFGVGLPLLLGAACVLAASVIYWTGSGSPKQLAPGK